MKTNEEIDQAVARMMRLITQAMSHLHSGDKEGVRSMLVLLIDELSYILENKK